MHANVQHPDCTAATNPSALIPVAVGLIRDGHFAEAMATIDQGLRQEPDHFGLLNNKGLCAMRLGDPVTAEAAYRKALAIRPDFPEAWNNLGNLLAATGRPADAEAAYRKAMAARPGYAGAQLNLAQMLFGQRRLGESEDLLTDLVAYAPTFANAFAALAAVRLEQGRPDAAEDACRKALALQADHVDALGNLGLALANLGRLAEAEAACDAALALQPGHATALLNRAEVLGRMQRPADAEAAYVRARESGVHSAAPDFGLGNLCWRGKRLAEAEAHFREAIARDPDFPMAWNNLGGVLWETRRPAEAEAAYRRELARDSRNREARWNLALLLLAQGRYAEGWQAYEVRLGDVGESRHADVKLVEPSPVPTTYRLPRLWRGESIEGKRMLAWSEGGYGDEIQFVRYLPLLRQMGVRQLALACKQELKPLFERQGFADRVFAKNEWRAPMADEYDFWCPLLSLPLRFETTLESIPAALPYLHADPERVEKWRPRLAAPGLCVGLVWRGNPAHENDAARSLPGLATLAPLWSVPGIRFVSLQKGAGEHEAQTPPGDQPLLHLGGEITDFADTAAIASLLDLVISVDTSSAHLAAATGTPTWILLPEIGTDWRWLTGRDDSPWYPGVVRLFRQAPGADWQNVIELARQALLNLRKNPKL